MSIRFRRSVRLFPGIRLNFSKSGVSTSVKTGPFTTNYSQRGVRHTASIPGTGVSFVSGPSHSNAQAASTQSEATGRGCIGNILWGTWLAIRFPFWLIYRAQAWAWDRAFHGAAITRPIQILLGALSVGFLCITCGVAAYLVPIPTPTPGPSTTEVVNQEILFLPAVQGPDTSTLQTFDPTTFSPTNTPSDTPTWTITFSTTPMLSATIAITATQTRLPTQTLYPTQTRWPTATNRPATPRPVNPAPPPSGGSTGGCCKICTTGKACGDSCISRSYTCHKGPGCACNG